MQLEEFSYSRAAIGTGTLGTSTTTRAAVHFIEKALSAGIAWVDTARSYGDGRAERIIGDVLASMPNIVVATKVGLEAQQVSRLSARRTLRRVAGSLAPHGLRAQIRRRHVQSAPPTETRGDFGPAFMRASIAQSLRELRRPRVDVLLLHQVTAADFSDDLLQVLSQSIQSGIVGKVGIATSLQSTQSILEISDFKPSVVQVPGGPLYTSIEVPDGVQVNYHSVLGPGGAGVRRLKRLAELASDDLSLQIKVLSERQIGNALIQASIAQNGRGKVILPSRSTASLYEIEKLFAEPMDSNIVSSVTLFSMRAREGGAPE